MTTQALPDGGDFDPYHQPLYQSMSSQYYDRSAPYNQYPYHHRRSHRSEYPGRHSAQTLIHEPEIAGPNGQASRKRIGVACTRCRKRKIKCTGDVGDGSGCAACKAQGVEGESCTFNRVGAKIIPQYEEFLANSQPPVSQDVPYGMESMTSPMTGSTPYHAINHRQSLPILQTRTVYPESYEAYSASPIDGNPYSSYSAPRNDSFQNSYDNGYRSWSNATLLPQTSATSAYEQSPGYSFGSISNPSFPGQQLRQQPYQQSSRVTSVTAESFSPLNMGHLYTSLPTQTAQSRRLPIPQTTPSYEPTPYSGPDLPEIRPLAEPRTRLNSAHSRIAVPWASDSASYTDSRNGSSISLAPPHGMALQPLQSTSMVQEPVVGYHYSTSEAVPTISSPSVSPTFGPPPASGYGVGPAYSTPMTPTSYASYYGLPPITIAHRPEFLASRTLNVPYSYNSDTTTASYSERSSSDASSAAIPTTRISYATIQHPQPQHAASAEALRRQTSFDHHQQQPREGPSQRISVSDLSGGGPAHSGS